MFEKIVSMIKYDRKIQILAALIVIFYAIWKCQEIKKTSDKKSNMI